MTAKRNSQQDDDKELPAPPCFVPKAELDAAKANLIDTDSARLIVRPVAMAGGIASAAGFIVYATLAVAGFMHETRQFQKETTEALESNGRAIKAVADQVGIVTVRQNNVIGDRWRFSDMQPWAYQLEKANRDVVRTDGTHGIVVPEPIAKPQP